MEFVLKFTKEQSNNKRNKISQHVNTLPLQTGDMFETKAILSQVTPHYPQAPKQHY